MDKKNLIIGVTATALGVLALEYVRLVHDFKLVINLNEANKRLVKAAEDYYTAVAFEQIVDNYDE